MGEKTFVRMSCTPNGCKSRCDEAHTVTHFDLYQTIQANSSFISCLFAQVYAKQTLAQYTHVLSMVPCICECLFLYTVYYNIFCQYRSV